MYLRRFFAYEDILAIINDLREYLSPHMEILLRIASIEDIIYGKKIVCIIRSVADYSS